MKYIDSILILMREPPSDIGEPQEEFCDRIAEIFDDPDGRYEVLDRNLSDDPFEPDIEVMDSDEWAFNILCYYVEDTNGFRTTQTGRLSLPSVWEEPPIIRSTSISPVSSVSQMFISF